MKKKQKKSKKTVSHKRTAPRGTNSAGVTPLNDSVLIRPLTAEELENKVTSFGIIIPETAKKKPDQGIVVAVGPGRRSEQGTRMALEVAVGDRVYFKKPWDDPLVINGVEYYVVTESDITLIQK